MTKEEIISEIVNICKSKLSEVSTHDYYDDYGNLQTDTISYNIEDKYLNFYIYDESIAGKIIFNVDDIIFDIEQGTVHEQINIKYDDYITINVHYYCHMVLHMMQSVKMAQNMREISKSYKRNYKIKNILGDNV